MCRDTKLAATAIIVANIGDIHTLYWHKFQLLSAGLLFKCHRARIYISGRLK